MDQQQLEKTLTEALASQMGGIEKNFNTIIDEKFKETVKELNLDKLSLKHGMFPVVGGEDEKATKAKRFNSLIRYAFNRELEAFKKNMNGNVDSDGGFLVPTEFVAEVQRIAEAFGIVRRYANVVPMSSDKKVLPSDAGSVTLTWQGVQANALTKTKPSFGNIVLNTDTLGGITLWSNQLNDDSMVGLQEYLMTLFAEAFAGEEDYQGLRGTGSPFVGVLANPDVNIQTMSAGNTAFTNVTLDDLIDLQTLLPVTALSSSAYIMHRTVWGVIQKLKQNNQNVVSFQNPVTPMSDLVNFQPLTPVGTVWNAPVLLSDKMPSLSDSAVSTPFIIFGSLRRGLMLGDRSSMTVMRSDVAVVSGESTFETLQEALRVTERIAIKVNLPKAFSVLKTAAV